tara:strand:+ start:513 stop:680 length:168 start_codon:yes stop_codon:yes gene_type:complete
MKINDITSDKKKQDLEKFERAKRFVKGFEGDVGFSKFYYSKISVKSPILLLINNC